MITAKQVYQFGGCLHRRVYEDEAEWLTNANMRMAFGDGLGCCEPEKGYGDEWAFWTSEGVLVTVYSRWGVMRFGGNANDQELANFVEWLETELNPFSDEPKEGRPDNLESSLF